MDALSDMLRLVKLTGAVYFAAARAGSGVMLAKLSELMFVEALRNYIEAGRSGRQAVVLAAQAHFARMTPA